MCNNENQQSNIGCSIGSYFDSEIEIAFHKLNVVSISRYKDKTYIMCMVGDVLNHLEYNISEIAHNNLMIKYREYNNRSDIKFS